MKRGSLKLEVEGYSIPEKQSKGFAGAIAAMSAIIIQATLGRWFKQEFPNDSKLEWFLNMNQPSPSMLAVSSIGDSDRTAFQIRHCGKQWVLRLSSKHGDFEAASAELLFGDESGLLEDYRIYKF